MVVFSRKAQWGRNVTDLLLLLGGLVGAIMAGLVWIARLVNKAEERGRKEAERDGLRDTQERMERGREAVSRNRGDDPVDRVRRNDGRWN